MRCELKKDEHKKAVRVIGEVEHRPSLMGVSVGIYPDRLESQLLDRKGWQELMCRTNKLNKSE
ncbi:MAG: hypothetical protein JSV97_02900 [candidate division WOR-3 bacterium]|nr:MAG: hypothetical protein JSV97_02900 [candidate division WOR-3 bacterium]